MSVTKIVMAVLITLTCWDVVTSYYGAVSIFVGFSTDINRNLSVATPAQHVSALLMAIILITYILSYRHILRGKNAITTGILYVGFVIDFLTSLYGTASATIPTTGQSNILQWGIVAFLSIAATASPILINQVLSDDAGY